MPWMAPMLCPRGEARKIGESGPSEKRSVNPMFRAARVSSLCMTALGRPVVLDVNMMCARSAALAGKGALRPAGAVRHVPAESSNRKTPGPMPAGRGSFPGDVAQRRTAVALHRNQRPRARQPGNVGDRLGIGAGRQTRGYGAEAQQRDERDLPVNDVRQKKDHDVATADSAFFQLFGEASGFSPQRAVAEPPAGCIGDGEAVLEALGEDGVAVAQALAWPPPLRAIPAFSLGAAGSGSIRKRCAHALRTFGICGTKLPHLPLPSPARNNGVSTASPTRVQRRRSLGQIPDDDIAFFIYCHF